MIACTIVSAEEHIFDGKLQSLTIAGVEGELSVHRGHAPLLTKIKPSTIQFMDEHNQPHVYYVKGGFLEIQPDKINILADTIIRSDDLNEEHAQKAIEDAKQLLTQKDKSISYAKARAQLAQAVAQLRTIESLRKKR